jgi:hypothetical protein
MTDQRDGTIHSATEHGTVASHSERATQPFRVAPTTETDVNTLSLDLIPVACLSLHDILFEFDSSFPTPNVSIVLNELPGLREQHKNAKGQFPPASIFGHADPVGGDVYNKGLSGRRTRAIYGLLVHDIALWEQLYNEEWHSKNVLATMRKATGSPDGASRKDLMGAYMTRLFPVKLDKGDFLGKGADPKGKADFQGCSEFNPLIILSQHESDTLPHEDRNTKNRSNRRVVVFLFRAGLNVDPKLWPCPVATDPSTAECVKRFFGPPKTGEQRRKPGPDLREFEKAGDTFACRFYDRVARLSPCEKPAPVPAATVEFVDDPSDTHTVDASNPVATFVRMGLWDHAFTCGNPGTLNDDVTEVKSFVGADSRRFYLRVKDTKAKDSVQIKWRTLKSDFTNLDAPADEHITLVETGAGTGIFGSRGLMLVSDADDQRQNANSGLPATFPTTGVRNFNQSDHRIRRADLEGFVEAEYTPLGAAPIKVKLPVFQRNPEKRRKMSLQIFVLRVAPGGNGVIDTSAASGLWTSELREIREIYGRIGIKVDTVVAPGTPAANIAANGADSIVLIDAPAGVNPLNVSFNPLNGANDERRLGATFPAQGNTIRIFYVGGLASGNRAESWPDIDFAALPQHGSCFLRGIAATYNAAHEMGHVLTDKAAAKHTGHYVPPAGAPGTRLCTNQNLMRNGTSVVEGVLESKRLYDEADADGTVQVSKILGSPFTRAF